MTVFSDWLYDPRNQRYRVTLVEIHADSGLYKMATQPYFQPDGAWDDLLLDDIIIESSTDADVTAGDFTFSDAYRGHWGVEDFRGHPCRIWLGDTRWDRSAFVQLADLVIDHIQRTADDIYRVSFTDEIPALREVISGVLVGGQAMPVVYGSPFNVEPLMVDFQTLKYRFSESALSGITAVRDRGLTPKSFTKSPASGTVTMGVNIAGQVTGDIVAPISSLRDVVASLLTRAGIPTTPAQITMRRFPATLPDGYQTDLYITDQPTYVDLLNEIAEAGGAALTRQADGRYALTYLDFSGTPDITLYADDILDISEDGREPVYNKIVVQYSKNHTTQSPSELAGGVPLSDVKKYGSEYYGKAEAEINYTGSLHDGTLSVDTVTNLVGATAEINRLARLYAVPRRRWRIAATQSAILVMPGDLLGIDDDALVGAAMVMSARKNYTDLTANLEVIA